MVSCTQGGNVEATGERIVPELEPKSDRHGVLSSDFPTLGQSDDSGRFLFVFRSSLACAEGHGQVNTCTCSNKNLVPGHFFVNNLHFWFLVVFTYSLECSRILFEFF